MANFKPNELIMRCIENKDFDGVRNALTTIIYRDRNFSTGDFDSSVRYLKNQGFSNQVYHKYNGNKIDTSVMNIEIFNESIYNLTENFCDENIKTIKKIGKELYPINLPIRKEIAEKCDAATKVSHGQAIKKNISYNAKKDSSPITNLKLIMVVIGALIALVMSKLIK